MLRALCDSVVKTAVQIVAGSPGPGLRARIAELLLVGGGTLVLFPLLWLLRRALGAVQAEDVVDFVGFHAAVVINNPHFAVTYLLFYRGARSRLFGGALLLV